MEMMTIQPEMQAKIHKIQFSESLTVINKNSALTAYVANVNNTSKVRLVYKKVKQIAPDVDHIIIAYLVKQYTGFHDCGEHATGKHIVTILKDRNLIDTVVFITHIPWHFLHIEKVAKEAINNLQMK